MVQNDAITGMSVNVGGQMQSVSGLWQSGQLTASALVRYVQGDKSPSVRKQAVTELLSGQKLNEEQIRFIQSQFAKDVMLYQELLTDKRFVSVLQQANASMAYVPSETQSPVSERFMNKLIEQNTSELTADEIRKLCTLVTTKEAVFPNGIRLGFQREALLSQFIRNANQSVLCADLLKDFVATNRPCEFVLDDGSVKNRKAGGLYAWQYRTNGNQIQYTNADIQLKSNVFDETIYHEMRHHVTTPQINDAMNRENKNPIYHFISEVDTCAYDCFFDKRLRENKIISSIIENAHRKAVAEKPDLTATEQARMGNENARRILMSLYLKSPEERIDYYKELRRNGFIELPFDFDKITATNKVISHKNNTPLWTALNDMENLTQAWASYYAPNYVSAMKANLDNSLTMADFVTKYHSEEAKAYLKNQLGLEGVPSVHFAHHLAEKYLNIPQNREKNELATYIQNGNETEVKAYLERNPQALNQSMFIGQGTINLTPLHYALNENQFDMTCSLLQNPNIDLTIQNANGETPLGRLLMQFGKEGIDKQQFIQTAQLMMNQNAPIAVQDNIELFNQSVRTDNADILRYVLSAYKDWYSMSRATNNNPLTAYIQHRQSFNGFTLDENIVRQLVDFGISPQKNLPQEMFAQLQTYPFQDETLRTVFASQIPPTPVHNSEETTQTEVTEPVMLTESDKPAETQMPTTLIDEISDDKPSDNTISLTVEEEHDKPTDTSSPVQTNAESTVRSEQPQQSTGKRTTRPRSVRTTTPTVRSQPISTPSTVSIPTPSVVTPAQVNPSQSELSQQDMVKPSNVQSGLMLQSDNSQQSAKAEADKQSFLERNWEWLIGLGGVLIVIAGAYFLIRKQKKKTKKAENTANELSNEVSSLKDKLNSMQTQQDSSQNATGGLSNNSGSVNMEGIIGMRPIISDDTYNR